MVGLALGVIFLSILVCGLVEWFKNYFPETVKSNKMVMGIIQAIISIILGLVWFRFLEEKSMKFVVIGILATWGMAQYNYTVLLSTFKAIKSKFKGNQETNSN